MESATEQEQKPYMNGLLASVLHRVLCTMKDRRYMCQGFKERATCMALYAASIAYLPVIDVGSRESLGIAVDSNEGVLLNPHVAEHSARHSQRRLQGKHAVGQ